MAFDKKKMGGKEDDSFPPKGGKKGGFKEAVKNAKKKAGKGKKGKC